jgi:hypothetical protein
VIDLGLVLPLALFVVLAALFVAVLRRASRVIAEVREAVAFREGIHAVVERGDAGLAGLAETAEPLRRPGGAPIDEDPCLVVIAAAREAVVWGRERTRDLVAPPPLEQSRSATMDELARAEEAIRLIEHGVAVLASAPDGPRAMEGRTAVKRGYIRIAHARAGLREQATRVAAWRAAGEDSSFGRRRRLSR